MWNRRQFINTVAAGAAASALPLRAVAQASPTLEIAKLVVGFPAGGTTDAVTRRIAEKMRGVYAKNVIVENKPGAGGRIAAEMVKNTPPDGSTFLLTPASIITLYPHVYQKLAYNSFEDFIPVSTACTIAFGFGVGPAVPESVKTMKDFLAWAKANPKDANYGSPATGSPPHFLGALLSKESEIDLKHVPYRGSAPGIQDLLGGQIASMSSPIGDYLPHLASGKLRLLATSGPKRSRFAPDVPTYSELGYKDMSITEWYGFFAPARTPAEHINRAAAAIKAASQAQDVIDGFLQLGLEAGANTPAQLSASVKSENQAWGPIVKRVGFTPEA
jgi:tripartite-type tricarboxylate transporter receptor subunit TctC